MLIEPSRRKNKTQNRRTCVITAKHKNIGEDMRGKNIRHKRKTRKKHGIYRFTQRKEEEEETEVVLRFLKTLNRNRLVLKKKNWGKVLKLRV